MALSGGNSQVRKGIEEQFKLGIFAQVESSQFELTVFKLEGGASPCKFERVESSQFELTVLKLERGRRCALPPNLQNWRRLNCFFCGLNW